jgi:pimeloyl-ACP methyl ester carboxylesterase
MKLLSIGLGLAAVALLAAPPALAAPVNNIVLVHGAWADGSGWKGVYDILKQDGYNVTVVSNPLTTLADDVAATDRVIERQDGPVILVGHSYGGAVITEAGDDEKVAGLVYVAAFVPDAGESVLGLLPKDGPQPPIEVSKDGFIFFANGAYQAAFAAGVPAAEADFMQASQVPLSAAAGNTPLTVAAWKTKPSWYIVSADDLIIPPDAERGMAKRAGASTVEMAGGHVAFVVDPQPVADLIEKAANGIK